MVGVGLLGCVALALSSRVETSRAPFVMFDVLVCFLILMMEDFGCWDDAFCWCGLGCWVVLLWH